MDKETYELFRDKLINNIYMSLSAVPDNQVMEHYAARNIESYMRSLEILERMEKQWQD